MFGWFSDPASRDSRTKRRADSLSLAATAERHVEPGPAAPDVVRYGVGTLQRPPSAGDEPLLQRAEGRVRRPCAAIVGDIAAEQQRVRGMSRHGLLGRLKRRGPDVPQRL